MRFSINGGDILLSLLAVHMIWSCLTAFLVWIGLYVSSRYASELGCPFFYFGCGDSASLIHTPTIREIPDNGGKQLLQLHLWFHGEGMKWNRVFFQFLPRIEFICVITAYCFKRFSFLYFLGIAPSEWWKRTLLSIKRIPDRLVT